MSEQRHGAPSQSGATDNPASSITTATCNSPKKGRAIFTSQQDRQRRRVQVLLAVLIVAAIALALFWFFVLR